MSDKKKKLRQIASGDTMSMQNQQYSTEGGGHPYPLAEKYQETGGRSTKISVEGTVTTEAVTIGSGKGAKKATQGDKGMTPKIWKSHLTDKNAKPSLAKGVTVFEFGDKGSKQTYSLTEVDAKGNPVVVKA